MEKPSSEPQQLSETQAVPEDVNALRAALADREHKLEQLKARTVKFVQEQKAKTSQLESQLQEERAKNAGTVEASESSEGGVSKGWALLQKQLKEKEYQMTSLKERTKKYVDDQKQVLQSKDANLEKAKEVITKLREAQSSGAVKMDAMQEKINSFQEALGKREKDVQAGELRVEELENEKKQLLSELQEKDAAHTELSQIMTEKMQMVQTTSAETEEKLKRSEAQKLNLTEEMGKLQELKQKLEADVAKLEAQSESENEQLKQMASKVDELLSVNSKYQEEISNLKESLKEQEILSAANAELTSTVKNLEEQKTKYEGKLKQLWEASQSSSKQIASLEQEKAARENNLKKLEVEKDEQAGKFNDEMSQLKTKLVESQKALEGMQRLEMEKDEQAGKFNDEISQLKIELANCQKALEGMKQLETEKHEQASKFNDEMSQLETKLAESQKALEGMQQSDAEKDKQAGKLKDEISQLETKLVESQKALEGMQEGKQNSESEIKSCADEFSKAKKQLEGENQHLSKKLKECQASLESAEGDLTKTKAALETLSGEKAGLVEKLAQLSTEPPLLIAPSNGHSTKLIGPDSQKLLPQDAHDDLKESLTSNASQPSHDLLMMDEGVPPTNHQAEPFEAQNGTVDLLSMHAQESSDLLSAAHHDQSEQEALEDRVKELETIQLQLQTKLAEVEQEKKKTDEDLQLHQTCAAEASDLSTALQESKSEILRLTAELSKSTQDKKGLQEQHDQLSESFGKVKEENQVFNSKVTELEARQQDLQVKLEEAREAERNALEAIAAQRAQADEEIKILRTEKGQLSSAVDISQAESQRLNAALEEIKKSKEIVDASLKEASDALAKIKEEHQELQTQYASLSARNEDLEVECESLSVRVTALEKCTSTIADGAEQTEAFKKSLEEKNAELENVKKALEQEKDQLLKQTEKVALSLQSRDGYMEELESKKNEALKKLETIHGEHAKELETLTATHQEELDEKQATISSLQDAVNTEKQNVEALKTSIEEIQNHSDQLEMDLEEVKAVKTGMEERILTMEKEMQSRIRDSHYTSQENRDMISNLEKTINKLQAQKQANEQTHAEACQKLQQQITELEAKLQKEKGQAFDRKKKMKAYVESLTTEKNTLSEKVKELTETITAAQTKESELLAQISHIEGQKEELQILIDEGTVREEKLQESLNDCEQELDCLMSKGVEGLEETKSLLEEHKQKRLQARSEMITIAQELDNEREIFGIVNHMLEVSIIPKVMEHAVSLEALVSQVEKSMRVLAARQNRQLRHRMKRNRSNPFSDKLSLTSEEAQDSPNAGGHKLLSEIETRAGKAAALARRLERFDQLQQELRRVTMGVELAAQGVDQMYEALGAREENICASITYLFQKNIPTEATRQGIQRRNYINVHVDSEGSRHTLESPKAQTQDI